MKIMNYDESFESIPQSYADTCPSSYSSEEQRKHSGENIYVNYLPTEIQLY